MTDTAPDTAMPAEIASLVERLRHMGDYTRRYRLHVNYCKTANEAAAALEAQAAELAKFDFEKHSLKVSLARAEAQLAEARKALDALDRMSRGVDWCDQDEQARRWSAARRALAGGE